MKKNLFTVSLFLFVFFSKAQLNLAIYMVPASVPCDTCFTFTADFTGGTPPYTYQWNFIGPPSVTYTTQVVNHCLAQPLDSAHSLYFQGSDAAGNSWSWPMFASPIKSSSKQICLVTVDSVSGKNLIMWEQTTDPSVVGYNIYKETTTAGIYSAIGNVHRNNLSTFLDMTSNPIQVAARYKIAMIDSCGNESQQSYIAAKTIHLTVSPGVSNTWNLNWDNAEGFTPVKFRIWRKKNGQLPVLIDSVQSSLNSYTDLSAPGGVNLYTLEAICSNVCNPSFKINNSVMNAYTSSFSNFSDNAAFVGIKEEIFAVKISMYPNPTSGKIYVAVNNFENKIYKTELVGLSGNLISKQEISLVNGNGSLNFEVENGMYLLKFYSQDNKMIGIQRMAVSK